MIKELLLLLLLLLVEGIEQESERVCVGLAVLMCGEGARPGSQAKGQFDPPP